MPSLLLGLSHSALRGPLEDVLLDEDTEVQSGWCPRLHHWLEEELEQRLGMLNSRSQI